MDGIIRRAHLADLKTPWILRYPKPKRRKELE
jgi:hypothetical protein